MDESGYEFISDILAEVTLALQGDKDMGIDLYDRFGAQPVELLGRISTCMKSASTGEVDFWTAWNKGEN